MYSFFFKRILDSLGAIIFLFLFSPIIVLIILIQLFPTKGAVFFFQKRPGLNTKPFTLIKFRNMNEKTDQKGVLLPEEQRITRVGKFLRRTNMDELPQLFNVLKGDMSLIGPRPLLMDYLPLYNATQLKRHSVKPGLTGWAQINGGNDLPWEKKFDYDLEYVKKISFYFDLKIIAFTIWKVLSLQGFNTGKKIMEKFNGTQM